jgi:ArsR family transcriptional regulator
MKNTEKVFSALASAPRRKILAYLSATSMTAGEIADRFEMSKPSLSKHLSIRGLYRAKKRDSLSTIHWLKITSSTR